MIRYTFALSLALALPAQAGVLTVSVDGTKDFTTIQSAIDAALPGDTVVVWGTAHAGFTVDAKPVSVAHRGQTITLSSPMIVRNLPAGSEVLIAGFKVASSLDEVMVRLDDNAGELWLQRVEARPLSQAATAPAAMRVTNCADVVIVGGNGFLAHQAGSLGAGAVGLWATDSRLSIYSTWIRGGTGAPASAQATAAQGGAALRASSCDIVLADCSVQGGTGGTASLVNCGPGEGGPALWFEGTNNLLRHVDTYLGAGPAGTAWSCPAAQDAPVVQDDGVGSVLKSWEGKAATIVTTNGSVIEGAPLLLQYGERTPSSLAFLAVGFEVGTTTLSHFGGRLALGGVPAFLFVEPTMISGLLPIVVPSLPPGVESWRLYLQPVQLDSGTGDFQLGSAWCMHVLDTAYF